MKLLILLAVFLAGCATQAPTPPPTAFNYEGVARLIGATRAHQRFLEDLEDLRAARRLADSQFKELTVLSNLSEEAMQNARTAVLDGDTQRFENAMKMSAFVIQEVRQFLTNYEAAARKMESERVQAKPKPKPKPK